MTTRCYLIEFTGQTRYSLRRYRSGQGACVGGVMSYHNAESAPIADGQDEPSKPPRVDPRWPTRCACGYEFEPSDPWQVFGERLVRRADTGEVITLRSAPPGAIYNADWSTRVPEWTGPDGRALHVRLPNGHDWAIDSRASNCDSPCANCGRPYYAHTETSWWCSQAEQERARSAAWEEITKPDSTYKRYVDARPHKCWVRHGEPPDLHVDKAGVTCNAGAGSILSGDYHGFLHNGFLT